jgi:hypothetical protein
MLNFYSAWDEIYEVFGDGRDYEWALAEDDDNYPDAPTKLDTNFQDVSYCPASCFLLSLTRVGLRTVRNSRPVTD